MSHYSSVTIIQNVCLTVASSSLYGIHLNVCDYLQRPVMVNLKENYLYTDVFSKTVMFRSVCNWL